MSVRTSIDGAVERVKTHRPTQGVLIALALYSTLYWVPYSPLPRRLPWGVIVQGITFGTSYALLAMGLILIYRTTRIVNFAYGAMGAMPGCITVGLFIGQGWNYWLAIAVGVLVGVVNGALVDMLIIRRFARSSRLVLTVATIGLAQILAAVGLGLLISLGANALIGNVDTPISASFTIRPYPVRGDHLLLLAIAPVAVTALAWFLLGTDSGRAVRAAAENQDRALLLGVPVRRLQTIVWAAAGGLSTVTFIAKVPFTGVTPDPSALTGATAILPGLAVAVIAGFASLPKALWGGIALGIVEWTLRWNVHAESIFDVTFLVVILVALLLRKQRTSRADTGESSWDSAGVLKPIPEMLRRLPEVRWPMRSLAAAGALAAVVVPLTSNPSTVTLMSFACIWMLVGVSLVVLTGWGGSVSLGQFAIVGVGAMTAGNLSMRWNVDEFVSLLAAVLAGAIISVLIGLPALRIRGLYLAVTTIAFAVALDSYFLNPVNFSSLVPDRIVRPVLWKRFDTESEWVAYFLCLGALVVSVLIVRATRRSRAGRVMIAVRDNERAAGSLAVPTTFIKLQTFMLSGSIAGLAGGLYVLVAAGTGQGTFRPEMSVQVFSFAVIGGLGTIAGGITGVGAFRLLDFVIAKYAEGSAAAILRLSLSGGGLLIILYFLPGGLWQLVQQLRDRYLRMVAARRDLIVPSLLADRRDPGGAPGAPPEEATTPTLGAEERPMAGAVA